MFTQTSWDQDGYAQRDPDSTTYIGAVENAEQFGTRLYVEVWKRGWGRAETKVVIGDGALSTLQNPQPYQSHGRKAWSPVVSKNTSDQNTRSQTHENSCN